MEKIEVSKNLKDSIIKDIDDISLITQSENNINYILPKLAKFQMKIRMIPELKNNPNNSFMTYLIFQTLGTHFLMFQDKSQKWYSMNETKIKDIRKEFLSYLSELEKGVKEDSLDHIINASKMYIYNTGKIFEETIFDFPE